MTLFVPTKNIVDLAAKLNLSWADVCQDLECAHSIQPIPGYDTRLRYLGERVQAYVEPGTYEGQDARFILHIRQRQVAAEPAMLQVVGRESKVVKSSKSGGRGTLWPTGWDELAKRAERQNAGVTITNSKTHLIVRRNGHQVQVLPKSASDWRAIRNAALQLRSVGIDVSRAR